MDFANAHSNVHSAPLHDTAETTEQPAHEQLSYEQSAPATDKPSSYKEGSSPIMGNEVDPESQKPTNYSHEDMSDADSDFESLSLYEKKATLVNRDLDQQGMGKYQWYIFFLCGFGYFLDLLWAQAFGLVVSPMMQEFGFSDGELGNIFTAFSAGLTAGAFVWGFLVDIIGRYWAFNFTVLWASIFGLVLGTPDSYNGVLVLTAFIGIGIGGNIPIDTTICLECLPQNRRWLLPTLSVFQPIGVVVCSGIAFAFIPNYSCAADLLSCNNVAPGTPCCTKADNYGWRYLMFTLGGITLGVFILRFVLFRFQESPKYLLYRGQDEKAVKSLHYIARFNSYQSQVTLETFTRLNPGSNESSPMSNASGTRMIGGAPSASLSPKEKVLREIQRYRMLISSAAMIRLTLLVWIIYGFDYWGFSIAGSFLPTILLRKGSALGLTLTQTYRSYVYIYIFGIPGVVLGTAIYGWRRISLIFSSAMFAATLFIFTTVNTPASYIGVNGLVYFFQSMFNGILYGITPEFYPAPIRGTACGVASFWGRIFSIVAPLAGAAVLEKSSNGVLYMAGGGVFICTIGCILLPSRYLGTSSL